VWVATALLAACASGVKLDDTTPVETRTPTSVGAGAAGAAGSSGTAQSQVTPVDLTKSGGAAANALPKVVYFDFDSFVVKDEYRGTIDAYAKALSADRKKRLLLEGHTDERGGREYNLALGQKRAEALKKTLMLLGGKEEQIEAVSLGEEKPVCTESTEECWAKNRRGDMLYSGEF
jgi:peptidoglycan-associated lipoprotein